MALAPQRARLWAAIAADMGVSLLVIFNGLRLLGASRGYGVDATPVMRQR